MVNLIEAQKPLLTGMMRLAGLRPIDVELEPGTTMHVWAPKHHAGKKGTTISPHDASAAATGGDAAAAAAKKPSGGRRGSRRKGPEAKPNVVLIHGFAAEGNVTFQFNFGVLVSRYNVYIPDLLFFGKSSRTDSADRSPEFQARCVAAALARLGVARCDVVGFSYGGMVAFKLAEARPDLVRSLAVSGSVVAMTDAVNRETMERLGAGSSAELLMPETLQGLKALFSVSMYRKMWFPDRMYKDYLKAMFTNRKERLELLQGLLDSNMDAKMPTFQQKIMLIWGEEDKLFDIELAKKMKEQLGEKCYLQGIPKAGHLLHLERPCAYNRQLGKFLAHVNSQETQATS
ncbi:putative aminoacrylate hydrolase RutD [Triticum dicoccoides]|uniref:putative aminoacrylate hydrolase RutD n=1 Tax=Triticum dicoccoides TaxID=85692 RepID=UPI000E7AF067|nr:putative aminoacrylate hydrolase RutD [Triticum dicoccoides]